ncbi:acyltransferase [Plantactinospora sp. BC1]|uniref:acyltransferase family protein n=1 Tax=Plantactinospora sp. BC1 TaxID=2108470 RepID=UPI001F2152F0|nr:acyltransferase [Plantactinospora sp. BC1]
MTSVTAVTGESAGGSAAAGGVVPADRAAQIDRAAETDRAGDGGGRGGVDSAAGAGRTGRGGADGGLHRLPSLTGLRWVAAMLVFGFHIGTMQIVAEPDYRQIVDWVFTLGLSGVQFFFILSGFVLVWSARPGDTKRAFWRRRAAKIYPNHVVTWAVVIALGLYWADPVNIKAALANLFLVQAWIPVDGYFYSINNVSWSLACEMFFYLTLPFVLPLIRRMRAWQLYAVLVAMPLLILLMWPGQQLLPETVRWWFTQIFPVVRSFEFWMGVAAAELMLRGKWRGPGLLLSTGLFVAIWVASMEWIRAELWTTVLAFGYILVIASAARADTTGRWSPWRSRPLVWLGEVSFAFYLVHVFLIKAIFRFTGHSGGFPGWQGPAVALAMLVVSLFAAWLLFRFVETPMMRLLNPRRRPRPTPLPPGVVRQRQPDRPGEPTPDAGSEPAGTEPAGTEPAGMAPAGTEPAGVSGGDAAGPGQERPERVSSESQATGAVPAPRRDQESREDSGSPSRARA